MINVRDLVVLRNILAYVSQGAIVQIPIVLYTCTYVNHCYCLKIYNQM